MFEEHARALKYLAWIAAGLFPLGIVIESLKQPQAAPLAVHGLLALVSVLCMAICFAEWRADKAPHRRRDRS